MEVIKIKHSFNAGDLIVALPGLRQLYRDKGKKIKIFQRLGLDAFYYHNQVNSTLDNEGHSVCMNERLFNMLKPLIEAQDYIESFEIWEGQPVDLDYDLSRDSKSVPMPAGLLHTYTEAIFPETSTDLSEKWIEVIPFSIVTAHNLMNIYTDIIDYSDKVIINRTQRYVNPYITYHFLKPYESLIYFSGTETEHKDFCEKNKLDIPLLNINNFYELAQVIAMCKFGIYNQSLHWHIADAQKTKRVLEVCAAFPNTFATGKNGYHAFGQAAMEYHVRKLISQ